MLLCCSINSFLKDIIKDISYRFDYVIIDGEAGIEQINRRVMKIVTHLITISDTSAKGIYVAETIEKVARSSISFSKSGFIINRVMDSNDVEQIKNKTELPFIGFIPEDEIIRKYDIEGKSFFNIPDCDALNAMKKVIGTFL